MRIQRKGGQSAETAFRVIAAGEGTALIEARPLTGRTHQIRIHLAAAGIPISTHLYPEVAAHVMRVAETAHWLEWQNWADPILQSPYEIKDSELHIPNIPGVGLEWNEEAIAANLWASF